MTHLQLPHMNTQRLIAFVVFVTFGCITGCGDDPVNPEPEETKKTEIQIFADSTTAWYQRFLSSGSPDEAKQSLIDKLNSLPTVTDAALSEDSVSVVFIYRDSTLNGFVTQSSVTGIDTTRLQTLLPALDATVLQQDNNNLPHNKNAKLMSPYRWHFKNHGRYDDGINRVGQLLSRLGYKSTLRVKDYPDDAGVVVYDFADFEDYGIVTIITHGWMANGDFWFMTGVPTSAELEALFKQELARKTMARATLDGIVYYCVGPKWMRERYPDKLERTLFYATGCNSMINSTMSNTIADANGSNGAAFLGWDRTVELNDAVASMKSFFEHLVLDSLNVGDGFEAVWNDALGTFYNLGDCSSGTCKSWWTELKKYGNDDLKLIERGCDVFPPPLGEMHTYLDLEDVQSYTVTTETTEDPVGGYVVYRVTRSDNPPGMGMYVGCDPDHGEVDVATDWWVDGDPSTNGKHYWEPPFFCEIGGSKGTFCEWSGTFANEPMTTTMTITGFEDVVVPYGSFSNVTKLLVTDTTNDWQESNILWVDDAVGLIKAEEVETGFVTVLTEYSPPLTPRSRMTTLGLARAHVRQVRLRIR